MIRLPRIGKPGLIAVVAIIALALILLCVQPWRSGLRSAPPDPETVGPRAPQGGGRESASHGDSAFVASRWIVEVQDERGVALPGCRVAIFAADEEISRGTSDSSGSVEFRVKDLPENCTVLALEALPNSLRLAADDLSRDAWIASGGRHGIRMPRLAKIQLRLRSRDGSSAAGIQLKACALAPELLGESRRSAFIDVAGGGRFFTFVSSEDGSCGPLYLSAPLDVNFTSQHGEAIIGRIESSMNPSGALGSTFRVGEAGEYYVEFEIGASPAVEIEALGEQGQIVPGCRVWIWYRLEGESSELLHSSSGGVGKAGRVTVSMPNWNPQDSVLQWWACTWEKDIGLQYHRGSLAPGSFRIELKVGSHEPSTTIRGRFVEAEDSSPVQGAPVHLMIDRMKLLSAETGEDGEFRFPGVRLPPASWEAGRGTRSIQFRVGTSTALMLSTESWYRKSGQECPDFFAGIEVSPGRDTEVRVHAPPRR